MYVCIIAILYNSAVCLQSSSPPPPPPPPQALERELAPVEEKLSKLGEKVRQVVVICPKDTREVQGRHAEITGMWNKLKVGLYTIIYLIETIHQVHMYVQHYCSLVLSLFPSFLTAPPPIPNRTRLPQGKLPWQMHYSSKASLQTPEIWYVCMYTLDTCNNISSPLLVSTVYRVTCLR